MPEQVKPVEGSFFGPPDAFRSMHVDVDVRRTEIG